MDNKQQSIEVMESAYEYIFAMNNGIVMCEQNFVEGKQDIAYNIIAQILEGYMWLIDAVTLTNKLNDEYIELSGAIGALKELEIALEAKDKVLIIDILKYEILENINLWQAKLKLTLKNLGVLLNDTIEEGTNKNV